MRRVLLSVLILALAILGGCASSYQGDVVNLGSQTKLAEAPPLIDRELFFGDPEISGAQLSPDGQYVSFIKPYRDVRNIYVKSIDEPFSAARPVTADERPVPGYFWSQDGRFILYVQDKGGNENYHVYSVDPGAAPEAASGVPPARDLTPLDDVRAAIYAVPKKTPGHMIVGLNDRDPAYHDVYRIDIATGERELMIENTQEVGNYDFDLDGNVRLAMRQTEGGGTEILRVEGDQLTRIYDCTYEEMCYVQRFHRDGKRAYMITNKGSGVDLSRLVLLDPQTGDTQLVESDPAGEVDFGGAAFSEDNDELIATIYVGDRVRIYPKTKEIENDLNWLRKNLPEGELGFSSVTQDMSKWLVSISSDVDPGSVYLYDRQARTVDFLYRGRPDLPIEDLAHMKPVRYKARDGLEIPAYLTLPRGVEPRNLPVVLHPHGGPWARDRWGYDPYAQFLANRGYAVLQPNFRSSMGYGKKFLNAGNRTWGTGAMQHDLTDGVQYLIDEGIADPERIAIFGGSYGGYATLAGVTFTPDLYACGIPYVAPSNIITLIESFPAYWRPFLEGSWYKRVGDPEVEADRQDMEARSPLNFVDRIKVPLLVVHGANDPRVKQDESDRIVVALRDKGHDVEYIVAPDEGHGFRAPGNRMALAASMEKFLAKLLGGRYQPDMPADVAGRLAEITVDVASVTLPDPSAKVAMADAETAPLPVADGSVIQPAQLQYEGSLEMGPQTMDMNFTRVVEATSVAGRDCWRITDTLKMAMGEMVDAFDVDKKTLMPVQRSASGMGMMELAYSPAAITGKMGGGGQTMDVNVPLKAPVLGDGPGLELAIAGLPLAFGFSTPVRMYDPMTQKVRVMKLSVTGQEMATSPAGSFDAFVVALESLDGETGGEGTLRVMQKAPHHVITGEIRLPAAMGGGAMNYQLVSTSASLP